MKELGVGTCLISWKCYCPNSNDDEDEDEDDSQPIEMSDDLTNMNYWQNMDDSLDFGSSGVINDTASDIDLGGFQWFGCAGHHLNLVINEGFIKCQDAARLLKKCKRLLELSHKTLPGWPVLYDITKYQEELHLPKDALLQEVTIRWWSVIAILTNLINNIEPVGQALKNVIKFK